MTALTIRVEPADARRAEAASATLAGLPQSYAVVGPDEPADVVVVSGETGWASRVRVAAAAGARAVVVNDPEPDAVPDLSDFPAAVVVLAETWASNPVLRSVREEWSDALTCAGLIDASAIEPLTGRDLGSVVFAQLRALQSLGVSVATLAIVVRSASAVLARGRTTTGATIVLSAARSAVGSGELAILVVGGRETIGVTVPDSRTARPGEAILTTPEHAVELPTIWETAQRTAWLETAALLRAGTAPDPLPSFGAAVTLLR